MRAGTKHRRGAKSPSATVTFRLRVDLPCAARRVAGRSSCDMGERSGLSRTLLRPAPPISAEITSILAVVRPGAAPPTAAEATNLAGAISRLIAGLWPGDIVGTLEGSPASEDLAA